LMKVYVEILCWNCLPL